MAQVEGFASQVLASGKPLLISVVTQEVQARLRAMLPPEYQDYLSRIELRSFAILPVTSPERTLGALTLLRLVPGPAYTEDELPVQPRPLDFHELAGHAVEDVRLAHPERNILFQAGSDAHGEWDADRMAQVITNLVGNAVQRSPADTPVRVGSRGEDVEVVLEVHNEGSPIPAEELPTLFEPFRRGRSTGGRAVGSVGLGLFISRRIVEAHGGTIEVRSREGEGTTFTVRLPRFRPGPMNS